MSISRRAFRISSAVCFSFCSCSIKQSKKRSKTYTLRTPFLVSNAILQQHAENVKRNERDQTRKPARGRPSALCSPREKYRLSFCGKMGNPKGLGGMLLLSVPPLRRNLFSTESDGKQDQNPQILPRGDFFRLPKKIQRGCLALRRAPSAYPERRFFGQQSPVPLPASGAPYMGGTRDGERNGLSVALLMIRRNNSQKLIIPA